MLLSGVRTRVLQLHPTRRCNLRCLHCYSSSGPKERDGLSVALLRTAIRQAAALGYRVLSVSGGEPLLYAGLRELLAEAKRCGLYTTVTTNGMLLDSARLGGLRELVDFFAISIDGERETHNRLRQSRRAFDTTLDRLGVLRASGALFGFAFTLTRANWEQIETVVGLGIAQGASLVQIHPLEPIGRALAELPDEEPDAAACACAWLECVRLSARHGQQIRLQLDVLSRDTMRDHAHQVIGAVDAPGLAAIARLVSPLVIEADGTVVPVQSGFPRHFALGRLGEASLRQLAARWLASKQSAFRAVCEATAARMRMPSDLPFFNWYAELQRVAEAQAAMHDQCIGGDALPLAR